MEIPEVRRFTIAVRLSREERQALKQLAHAERLPMAQVLRRLIWQAAQSAQDRQAQHG